MLDERLQTAVATVIDSTTGELRGRGITVTIRGEQENDGRRRKRVISIRLAEEEAQQFVSNPSYAALGLAYGLDEDFFFTTEEVDGGVKVEAVQIEVVEQGT